MGQSGRGFPIKAGSLAKLERQLTDVLDERGHSPDEVAKAPIVKAILALSEPDRVRLVVSLCERIAWMQNNDVWPGVIWHAHEILKTVLKKKLPATAADVERIVSIASSLGDNYVKLPMVQIVALIERVDTSAKLERSIKTLARRMADSDDATHRRLATRLTSR